MSIPAMPSPAAARQALALIDHGLTLRCLRVLLYIAATPGDWTQRGLSVALRIGQPELSTVLRHLVATHYLTTHHHRSPQTGREIIVYRLPDHAATPAKSSLPA